MKGEKGITLVALIITIIILLVLVVVSINLVMNSGIIDKAEHSISKYIESEIAKRIEAKKQKDYETADSIRAKLDEQGIILNDTVEGTTWDIKELY